MLGVAVRARCARKLTQRPPLRAGSAGTAPSGPPPVLPDFDRIRGALSVLQSKRRRLNYTKKAAVLVALCEIEGVPSLLLTRRTDTVGTHKGQVAFPGGHSDDSDSDATATALREAEEEIGLNLSSNQILGWAHDFPSITQVAVTPVIASAGPIELRKLRCGVFIILFLKLRFH